MTDSETIEQELIAELRAANRRLTMERDDLTVRLAAAEATIAEALYYIEWRDVESTTTVLSAYRPVAAHPEGGPHNTQLWVVDKSSQNPHNERAFLDSAQNPPLSPS